MQGIDLNYNIGAIVFLIVGVGIATLVLIFVGVLGGQVYQQVEPDIDSLIGSVANETFTPTFQVLAGFAHDDITNGSLSVVNVTDGEVILLTNFTIDYDDGTYNLTNSDLDGYEMNATYDYGDSTIYASIKNSIISGFSALDTTGSYLPIVVLAVIIFIVLSIVMGLGAFRPMGSSGYSGAL